jgi:hypothetical protein
MCESPAHWPRSDGQCSESLRIPQWPGKDKTAGENKANIPVMFQVSPRWGKGGGGVGGFKWLVHNCGLASHILPQTLFYYDPDHVGPRISVMSPVFSHTLHAWLCQWHIVFLTRFSWGSLGISKQFLKTVPWKCIIFTPSLGISEPFWRRHPSLPGISKWKKLAPSWNFQGPHPPPPRVRIKNAMCQSKILVYMGLMSHVIVLFSRWHHNQCNVAHHNFLHHYRTVRIPRLNMFANIKCDLSWAGPEIYPQNIWPL